MFHLKLALQAWGDISPIMSVLVSFWTIWTILYLHWILRAFLDQPAKCIWWTDPLCILQFFVYILCSITWKTSMTAILRNAHGFFVFIFQHRIGSKLTFQPNLYTSCLAKDVYFQDLNEGSLFKLDLISNNKVSLFNT